jgi:hypothetical protein
MERMLIDMFISITFFVIFKFVQLSYLALTCFVYINIASLVTKGYHG